MRTGRQNQVAGVVRIPAPMCSSWQGGRSASLFSGVTAISTGVVQESLSHRVHLVYHSGIKPKQTHHKRLPSPSYTMALRLDPLGKGIQKILILIVPKLGRRRSLEYVHFRIQPCRVAQEPELWSQILNRALKSYTSKIPQNDIGNYLGVAVRSHGWDRTVAIGQPFLLHIPATQSLKSAPSHQPLVRANTRLLR